MLVDQFDPIQSKTAWSKCSQEAVEIFHMSQIFQSTLDFLFGLSSAFVAFAAAAAAANAEALGVGFGSSEMSQAKGSMEKYG